MEAVGRVGVVENIDARRSRGGGRGRADERSENFLRDEGWSCVGMGAASGRKSRTDTCVISLSDDLIPPPPLNIICNFTLIRLSFLLMSHDHNANTCGVNFKKNTHTPTCGIKG